MPNYNPVKQFASDWPDKLRSLKVNETLYVSGEQLSIKQVRSLVANMNTRLKGDALYKSTSEQSTGGSVIVCVFRKKGAALKKRLPSRRVKSVTPVEPITKPKTRKKREKLMPKPMEAFAIVECVYVNGGAQSMRAADQGELEALLERCRSNEQVTEITTFQRTGVLHKQVQWTVEATA